ncbi:MAG: hypothetical protein LBO70_04470 [Clostridiales Family XIII bacterium]|jgi:amidase/formamidase|nr:hypothetical protein [Clostridiales Family XIII bacterium]
MNIGNFYALHGKIETEALSVVVSQFAPKSAATWDEIEENVDQIIARMDQASAGFPGFDLFVSPECAFQGYHAGKWSQFLLDIDGPQVQRVKDKCKELNVWGIFNPWLKPKDGRFCDNTAILVNNKGEIVLEYVKMNPWTPGEPTQAGAVCPVADGPKGAKIGIIICADGDYPEVWREAAVNGANVIVRVSHYMAPFDHAMQITNKAGAYCNQVYVVSCNTGGMDEYYNYFGESCIYNPDGTEITKAPTGIPYVIKADIYPGIIDHMRKHAVHANPMFTYKNRGASNPDDDGYGQQNMPYNAYKY